MSNIMKKPLIPIIDKKPLKRLQQEPITRIGGGGGDVTSNSYVSNSTIAQIRAKPEPPKLMKRELSSHAMTPPLPQLQPPHIAASYGSRLAGGVSQHHYQLPAPPPLYKAPVLNNSNANSSRLASASGTSDNQLFVN